MAGEFDCDVGDEMWLAGGASAEKDIFDTQIEIALDCGFGARAAADLRRYAAGGFDHAPDQRLIDRFAGAGAIEIDDVNAVGAGVDPARDGVFRLRVEYRDVVHAALAQAH